MCLLLRCKNIIRWLLGRVGHGLLLSGASRSCDTVIAIVPIHNYSLLLLLLVERKELLLVLLLLGLHGYCSLGALLALVAAGGRQLSRRLASAATASLGSAQLGLSGRNAAAQDLTLPLQSERSQLRPAGLSSLAVGQQQSGRNVSTYGVSTRPSVPLPCLTLPALACLPPRAACPSRPAQLPPPKI